MRPEKAYRQSQSYNSFYGGQTDSKQDKHGACYIVMVPGKGQKVKVTGIDEHFHAEKGQKKVSSQHKG